MNFPEILGRYLADATIAGIHRQSWEEQECLKIQRSDTGVPQRLVKGEYKSNVIRPWATAGDDVMAEDWTAVWFETLKE